MPRMKKTLKAGRGVGRAANWDGAKLRAARERSALSRRELAETLAASMRLDSVSAGAVEAWEAGRATPTRDAVRSLAKILRTRL